MRSFLRGRKFPGTVKVSRGDASTSGQGPAARGQEGMRVDASTHDTATGSSGQVSSPVSSTTTESLPPRINYVPQVVVGNTWSYQVIEWLSLQHPARCQADGITTGVYLQPSWSELLATEETLLKLKQMLGLLHVISFLATPWQHQDFYQELATSDQPCGSIRTMIKRLMIKRLCLLAMTELASP